MATSEQLIKYLQDHKQYFRINDIEKSTGIPQSTINKAMSGERGLTQEQEAKILTYLKTIKVSLIGLI